MTADEQANLARLVDEVRRLRAAAEGADETANWSKSAWELAKNDALRAWDSWRAADAKVQRLIRGE